MEQKTSNNPPQESEVKETQTTTNKEVEKKPKKKLSKKSLYIILGIVGTLILVLVAVGVVFGSRIRDFIIKNPPPHVSQEGDNFTDEEMGFTQSELDEIEKTHLEFQDQMTDTMSQIKQAEKSMDIETLKSLGDTQLGILENYVAFVNRNEMALIEIGVDVPILKSELEEQINFIYTKLGGKPEDGPSASGVTFSNQMFDTKNVTHITPLGELNGGYNEAQALASVMVNLNDQSGSVERMNIYAPTDMRLLEYSYHNIPEENDPNWSLTFEIGQRYVMTFWHIEMASEEIVAATTDTPKSNSSTIMMEEDLIIKEGELIGYTRGTKEGHNWNIILIDYGNENEFVNMARYKNTDMGKRLLGAICPFSLYPSDMRLQYIELMGYTKAGQADSCGSVSSDVKGALAGNWFLDDSNEIQFKSEGEYVTPLSIHMTSANSVVIDQFNEEQFEITSDNSSFIDPANIKDEHCYKLVDIYYGKSAGWAYFDIVSDTQMRVKYSSSGSCPSSYPGGGMTYYR